MAWTVLLLWIYGLVLIIGGIMGYIKAGSVPSLIAGLVCGLLAIFIGSNHTWHFAPYAALILSLVLIFIMGRRYVNTRKAMPAMLIVVLSVIVALAQVYILLTEGTGHDPL
ncbi:MAG: TMEM14 family protein [Methylacidiphilales bacterium]|nr:TMEM14 family protein [Candidatus Methylacidiphilales bacterium]